MNRFRQKHTDAKRQNTKQNTIYVYIQYTQQQIRLSPQITQPLVTLVRPSIHYVSLLILYRVARC